jgi:hypothetical protein
MNDFIAVLEEQLLTAHRERRPRRPPIPWRGGAIVVAAAATVAAVVAVVIALASPDDHRAAAPRPHAGTTPVTVTKPSEPRATVAVLNGTTVTGLARVAADTLVANGFREGVVTNDTTNQQRPRTTIYYEPGYEDQAQTAAGCLDIGLDRVRPMAADARVAADRADVAVFIGADKAK